MWHFELKLDCCAYFSSIYFYFIGKNINELKSYRQCLTACITFNYIFMRLGATCIYQFQFNYYVAQIESGWQALTEEENRFPCEAQYCFYKINKLKSIQCVDCLFLYSLDI
jgi:hypothetical protein